MWSESRRKLVLAFASSSALGCALVIAWEMQQTPRQSSWAPLCAGLGLGARAGLAAGWFAYDARLETSSRADEAPRAGIEVEAGPAGVFALSSAAQLWKRAP
ncbi:MAG TPA: hypothetical protein VM509_16215 [Planctomycetota bacterium]|nr:hypothetical protein [Planctomycetota bacterium]